LKEKKQAKYLVVGNELGYIARIYIYIRLAVIKIIIISLLIKCLINFCRKLSSKLSRENIGMMQTRRIAAQWGEKVDVVLMEVNGKDRATMRRCLHHCRLIRSLNKDSCRETCL